MSKIITQPLKRKPTAPIRTKSGDVWSNKSAQLQEGSDLKKKKKVQFDSLPERGVFTRLGRSNARDRPRGKSLPEESPLHLLRGPSSAQPDPPPFVIRASKQPPTERPAPGRGLWTAERRAGLARSALPIREEGDDLPAGRRGYIRRPVSEPSGRSRGGIPPMQEGATYTRLCKKKKKPAFHPRGLG